MRPFYALFVLLGLVFLAAPVSASAVPLTGDGSCMGEACEAINRVCQKVGGASCVGMDTASDDSCMGAVCDAINRVCHCLGLAGTVTAEPVVVVAPPAPQGPSCINCDAFNRVCQRLFHVNCLG
jgi:hypothetical protein